MRLRRKPVFALDLKSGINAMTETVNLKAMLQAARIPLAYENVKLEDVSGGKKFKDYLLSPKYKQDVVEGKGICIYGKLDARVRLFPVLARGFVLQWDQVYYIQLNALRHMLNDLEDLLFEQLDCSNALFITAMSDPKLEFPFSKDDRFDIETYLLDRARSNRRNYFSMETRLQDNEWWSANFRTEHSEYITNIAV